MLHIREKKETGKIGVDAPARSIRDSAEGGEGGGKERKGSRVPDGD